MPETVLVTGGAGFIGSHLVEALVRAGNKVSVIDDLSCGSLTNLADVIQEVEFCYGSVLDNTLITSCIQNVSVIFHLAAVVSVVKSIEDPLNTHRINTEGTLLILEAAAQQGARVIFASSAAVYGEGGSVPTRESDQTMPISPYGAQKLYGEDLLRSYVKSGRLEGYCLRYFNVYGPRQDPGSPYSGVVSVFFDQLARGEPITIHGDGEQTRDFISVHDVVRANLLAMRAPHADGLALNIGTGVGTSVNRLAELAQEAVGVRADIRHVDPRLGDIRESVSDPSQAKAQIAFRPVVSIKDGLKELSTALRTAEADR